LTTLDAEVVRNRAEIAQLATQYGGHIEGYLGTPMRRTHGLPGTTL
jgi:hypothetical protein